MAMHKRIAVSHGDVFPMGAFLKGDVEPMADFHAPALPDGSRPQQRDNEIALPMWQVVVLDADQDASTEETLVTIRFAAQGQPTPPANKSGLPWTPIEFVGLTALPYVDDNGTQPRIAWSYQADRMVAPSSADNTSPLPASKARAEDACPRSTPLGNLISAVRVLDGLWPVQALSVDLSSDRLDPAPLGGGVPVLEVHVHTADFAGAERVAARLGLAPLSQEACEMGYGPPTLCREWTGWVDTASTDVPVSAHVTAFELLANHPTPTGPRARDGWESVPLFGADTSNETQGRERQQNPSTGPNATNDAGAGFLLTGTS